MKRKYYYLLLISILLIPNIAYASTYDPIEISIYLFMELFVTIHMSIFVLLPISNIFSKDNTSKLFWKLFFIRIAILLIFDFFITPLIAIFDVFLIFIGAFLIIPICAVITKKSPFQKNQLISNSFLDENNNTINSANGQPSLCRNCNSPLKLGVKYCENCGTKVLNPLGKVMVPADFDNIYSLEEDKLIEEFIKKELVKAEIDVKSKLIPSNILKRKIVLNIIFSFLLFIYISMIFFHFPILTYVIGFIILLVYFTCTKKFNLTKYIKKQLKERPNEKISNIVMQNKTTFVKNDSIKVLLIGIIIAISLSLVIFKDPRIIYEKTDGGYAVRYYIFGLTNFTNATIPEEYNNEKVVSLRGNTFSNMFFLEKVTLPNTIKEIRGQAFKNCINLTDVNIPENLEYLGGGAFQDALKIKSIELPDTLTYLGGEAFSNALKCFTDGISSNCSFKHISNRISSHCHIRYSSREIILNHF